MDAVVGADGLARCWDLPGDPGYRDYHDREWGRPVRDEVALFEKLCLEGFQSGLSWRTILAKRPAFRSAFAGFEPATVAAFEPGDVQRLMSDAGIVRNRRKIEATITNARTLASMEGSLADLIWSHAPAVAPAAPRTFADVPASTPESTALSRELKRRGFAFVGPTTLYALMQACGVVNDHLVSCWVRDEVEAQRAR